ncbi:hypothetical protein DM02DRAFT_604691 [Periconia macrospinosa]|uniref:Zn(2)-C6 fungal-type domain-containing protein n=1 Tax=Periconia macrospinosa TaxID=97972 RepID=A0A2V1D4H7_9PLEO|nr:hypothetical protein DM02DRAFT_604691 [Periconia macrospinosa]
MEETQRGNLRPLRPILPAPAGGRRTAPEQPKRARISAACEACRTRKTKCNGHRPKCNQCVTRVTDCQYAETDSRQIRRRYDQLKEKHNAHEELIEMLQTMPEREAMEILRRIRAGDNVQAILQHVQEGNLLMELSVIPESNFRYEFPYILEMPAQLKTPDNKVFRSVLHEAIQAFEQPPTRNKGTLKRYGSPYLKPLHAAEMIDPLLSDACPSRWTNVSSDDRLMRRLLGAFFIHEYPWMTIFHKDYFLEDMISGQTRFCSSLLVNAILAKASTVYEGLPNKTMFWDPQNLGYRFLAEARRLWELIAETASLTTIQAGYLITAVYNVNGLDKIGLSYTLQAISMAYKMDLFRLSITDEYKLQNAKAITAWSLFSWQFMLSYYYFRPPYLPDPPGLPLPDPDKDSRWYPEIWLRYPQDKELYPMFLGHCFKTTCELHTILNGIAATAFSLSEKPRRLRWEEVSRFQARLYAWHDALPNQLSSRWSVFPIHLKIQSEYYSVLIMLFDSQLATADNIPRPLTTDQKEAAEIITAHAKVQLESLIRIYYLRHCFKAYDSHLMMFLTHLGNVTLARLAQAEQGTTHIPSEMIEALRSTLVLVLKGLYEQSQNYHVCSVVFRIMKESLSARDQNFVGQFIEIKDPVLDKEAILKASTVNSHWVFPRIKLNDSPEAARIETLAQEFARLSQEDAGTK